MQDAAALLIAGSQIWHRRRRDTRLGARRHVKAHDRAEDQGARMDRLMMAARLACWLAAKRPTALRSMAEAAAAYAGDSGFADRARHALQPGDALPEVAAAYARLREVGDSATRAGKPGVRGIAPGLERGWSARRGPGAGRAAAGNSGRSPRTRRSRPPSRARRTELRRCGGSLPRPCRRLGWNEFSLPGRAAPLMAAAVLPTVTEVSRASLLCGVLTRGDQATERAGFGAHAGLLPLRAPGGRRACSIKAISAGPELQRMCAMRLRIRSSVWWAWSTMRWTRSSLARTRSS